MKKPKETKSDRRVQRESYATFKKAFAEKRTKSSATWLHSSLHWMMYFNLIEGAEAAIVLRDLANFWEAQ